MCSIVRCTDCEKYTWSGCGQHVDQIFRNYNPDQLCKCKKDG